MSFLEKSERRGRLARRTFLFIFFAIAIFLVGGFLWATATPGETYSGPVATPDEPQLPIRLERHVQILASGQRNLEQASTVLSTVDYLTNELTSLGYAVEQQEVLAPANNLIVQIDAKTSEAPILIIGAHYDTAGSSPGADDNASGVAALIELARSLKQFDGALPFELQMVFFANEEPPYFKTGAMGSLVHANSLKAPERVMGMISLESVGYFSDEPGSQNYPFPLSLRYPSTGNFIAFAGDTSSRDFLRSTIAEFRKHARIPSVGGTAPSIVQGIDWSDHWGYSRAGIPAFMITDTAPFRNPNYHQTSDTPDTLDYQRLALVVEGLEGTLVSMIKR